MNKQTNGIEWLAPEIIGRPGYTWNPLAMLCTPVDRSCDNCWHRRMAKRMAANPKLSPERRAAYAGEGPPVLVEKELEAPLLLREPSVIAVQLMGDLFYSRMDPEAIKRVWDVMAATLQHTYVVLTKQPGAMREFIQWMAGRDDISIAEWPRNAWLGTSVCDQPTADERIPQLLQVPAAHYWVSYEPSLGPWTRAVPTAGAAIAATARRLIDVVWG